MNIDEKNVFHLKMTMDHVVRRTEDINELVGELFFSRKVMGLAASPDSIREGSKTIFHKNKNISD